MTDKQKKLKFGDLLPCILVSLFCTFLAFLYAPVQNYARNADDFIFDIYDLLKMMIPVWLAVFLLGGIIFGICRRIGKKFCSAVLVFCLMAAAAAYTEGTFLSGFLPALTGEKIYWAQYSGHRIWSILIWGCFLVLALILILKIRPEKLFLAVEYFGAFGTAMLTLTLIFSLNGSTLRDKENFYVSDAEMFRLSKDRNLILLVLDEIDGDDFNEKIESDPKYAEELSDFIFYRNTLGAYPGTKWAIPYLVSGKWYENQESFYEYREEAYVESPLFGELKNQGFLMGNYDEEIPPAEPLIEIFENLTEPQSESFQHPNNFVRMQLMLAGLQYLPFDLKQFCVLTPDNIYYDSLKETNGGGHFLWGNDVFLNSLQERGITYSDAPCFRMFHLQGAHDPFDYLTEIDSKYTGTYEDSIDFCCKLIAALSDALKEAGIYENTAIVVTGDHGHKPNAYNKMNPALFIKGMNEHHDFAVSDAPVSHEDFLEAFNRLLSGKNGEDIFDAREGDQRERRFLSTYVWDDDHIVEYRQTGSAADAENLKETGRVFTPSY